MGSNCLVRRSWTQASRMLARVARVEAGGAAVARGEKVGARMVAKAMNAMAVRCEQGNSGDLAGGVEGTFMAAPNNRIDTRRVHASRRALIGFTFGARRAGI